MDLYLQAMIHGEFASTKKSKEAPVVKDRFELAIEESAKAYADSIMAEEDFSQNQLISPQMRRAQLIEEIKEAMKLTELGQHIETAANVLIDEGRQYLQKEAHEALLEDFSKIESALEKFDLNTDKNFKEILGIRDASVSAILRVAIAKFVESEYAPSISLFALLTTLVSENADYWYRLGIAAQRSENLDLALRAYDVAVTLDATLIGARLFAAECHLILGAHDEAEVNYKEARKILETYPDEQWAKLVSSIESLVV